MVLLVSITYVTLDTKLQISTQIYPAELQLNKANNSDTKASFLDLHLAISNDTVYRKFTINVTILILKLSISHF